MKSEHSDLLQSRRTSYAGDGYSLFSCGLRSWGHKTPGPILSLHIEIIDQHVDSLNDLERLQLYRLFESDDEETIRKVVEHIHTTYSASLLKTSPSEP